MENLTFRMYADIRFNRNIDSDNDFISPGGYQMKMGDKIVSFDFEEYEGTIDPKSPDVLHIECKNPDYNTFEDLMGLKKENLERVVEIPEFFVFTGEKGETDLKPIKLLSCTFCLPYDNWTNIRIPTAICKKASLCCNI